VDPRQLSAADGGGVASGQVSIGEASMQAAELLGRELALAKAEARAQARQLSFGGAGLGAAAGLGAVAGLAFAAAVGLAIALVLPGWAAALIVGGAAALLAAIAGWWGARRLSGAGRPMQLTAESLKKDLALFKDLRR
jgi:Putative Actinobacterial Holin-X, holin superfamily III